MVLFTGRWNLTALEAGLASLSLCSPVSSFLLLYQVPEMNQLRSLIWAPKYWGATDAELTDAYCIGPVAT